MKFAIFFMLQLRIAFCTALVIGLVAAILVLVSGGVEGSISLDIDVSRADSIWFFLGVPLLVTLLFTVVSPFSFLVHAALSRVLPVKN